MKVVHAGTDCREGKMRPLPPVYVVPVPGTWDHRSRKERRYYLSEIPSCPDLFVSPPPHSWPRGGHCCNKSKSQGKPCLAMLCSMSGQVHRPIIYKDIDTQLCAKVHALGLPNISTHFFLPILLSYFHPPPLHHHQQASPGWLGLAGTTVSPCLCWENRHTSDHMDNNIETNIKSGIL